MGLWFEKDEKKDDRDNFLCRLPVNMQNYTSS